MKNSKLRRALLLVACAVLLVSISVSATLAYLTSKTEVVTNTFTVGAGISIKLDEANVYAPGTEPNGSQFGQAISEGDPGAGRGYSNEYKIVPNWTYHKDPIVTVEKGSGECYVFVKIINGLANTSVEIDEANTQHQTIGEQMAANGWINVSGEPEVYYYSGDWATEKHVVDAENAELSLPVFAEFTTKDYSNLDEATLKVTDKFTISITAYAVQSDGFATPAEAWAATFGKPNP